ncbi:MULTISPECIES: MBOAT family O-acyltransferase [Novosphingobium]|uniref:MBOAT family O-acyltransferase n=1 Tax=Novosphingobium TaxID=165696 RepID=UPI000D6E7857|nr:MULTISPECIES: MBOAT family O-acyltransferase [Novosphingobium]
MLFNSFEFLLVFLPIALIGYYILIKAGLKRFLFVWLVACSLVFYGFWAPRYALLLIASMAVNYTLGRLIERHNESRTGGYILFLGIALNVAVLGYFKYANFFIDNLNAIFGTGYAIGKIVLPLAISFYTFQQIAYLVDIRRRDVTSGGIFRYATFVIFFPQLIAGPIVHYKEMMPQFFGRGLGRFAGANLLIGITIFAIGLFKKTVIADSAALYATPIFDSAHAGGVINLADAWMAAITYTIQLYFDFSGYSDMAVGLARMFCIKLPPNFHSPLRAASIIDYWRRWHITLQQFIVSYMYQPVVLPLARFAAERRLGKDASFYVTVAAPTFFIFVVVGLWHGAGWTFVAFGAMHGFYLSVNEYWQQRQRKVRRQKGPPGRAAMLGYRLLTLLAVMFANVVFRAEAIGDALVIWRGMFDLHSIASLARIVPVSTADILAKPLIFAALGFFIIACLPNTQQFMQRYQPVIGWERWRAIAPPVLPLVWRPTLGWAAAMTLVLFLAVAFISRGQSEFIYFNF